MYGTIELLAASTYIMMLNRVSKPHQRNNSTRNVGWSTRRTVNVNDGYTDIQIFSVNVPNSYFPN